MNPALVCEWHRVFKSKDHLCFDNSCPMCCFHWREYQWSILWGSNVIYQTLWCSWFNFFHLSRALYNSKHKISIDQCLLAFHWENITQQLWCNFKLVREDSRICSIQSIITSWAFHCLSPPSFLGTNLWYIQTFHQHVYSSHIRASSYNSMENSFAISL